MLALEKSFLCGSIPQLVTPFRRGAVDYDAYARLVESQVRNGSHGVLVNGAVSEPDSLTVDERNHLVEVALEAAAGRTTIVVDTSARSQGECEALTRFAGADPDVDALLVAPPVSSGPPQEGLLSFYRALNTLHDKPWVMHHNPGGADVAISPETVMQIDRVCPTFVGIKQSSGDFGYVSGLFNMIGDELRVFAGREDTGYPMLVIGACGLMNAAGNLVPRSVADMCEAVWDGNLFEARDVYHGLFEINQALQSPGNPIALKYMMKRLGVIPGNDHRLPLMPAETDLQRHLDGILRRADLIG